MKYCETCGSKIFGNKKYCPNCGSVLNHESHEYSNDNIIEETTENLKEKVEINNEIPLQNHNSSKTDKLVGFLIGILFGFIGLLLGIFTKNKALKKGCFIGFFFSIFWQIAITILIGVLGDDSEVVIEFGSWLINI